jgi:hypothetical protein
LGADIIQTVLGQLLVKVIWRKLVVGNGTAGGRGKGKGVGEA